MTTDPAASAVSFDLDEDSLPEAVAIDSNADAVVDVISFDLDADSVPDSVMVGATADGLADQTGFDLDAGSEAGHAAASDEAGDDQELQEDSFTPPEDITDADVHQAMEDVQHSQAMNQYMLDTGVIS